MMKRRGFFKSLAGFVALAALDPEELIWRLGEKTIFLPAVGDGCADPGFALITQESLRILRKNLIFTRYISREYGMRGINANYDLKIGDTIRLRWPHYLTIEGIG